MSKLTGRDKFETVFLTLTMVVSLAITVAACKTTPDPLIVSGNSLIILADQFVATSKVMDSGYDTGVITKDQYKAWAAFGKKFQQLYPLAVDMWKLAEATNDPTLQAKVWDIANDLAIQLFAFTRPQ